MALRRFLNASLLATAVTVASFTYASEPSVDQVYRTAKAGQVDQAQTMMDQVLQAHPNSAKAHYVEAELLVRQGKLERARSELETAERLKPGLPFVSPTALGELRAKISGKTSAQAGMDSDARSQVPTVRPGLSPEVGYRAPAQRASGGIPLLPIFLLVSFLGVAWLLFRRGRSTASPSGSGYGHDSPQVGNPGMTTTYGGGPGPLQGYAPVQGYASGYGGAQGNGGLGSRVMGGLATGAALGAGMVAGEAIARHFTEDDRDSRDTGHAYNAASSDNKLEPIDKNPENDMGGDDFGLRDDSSWDDGGGTSIDDSDDWN